MIDEQIEFKKAAEANGLNVNISYGVWDNVNTERAWKIWLACIRLAPKRINKNKQKIPRLECKLSQPL